MGKRYNLTWRYDCGVYDFGDKAQCIRNKIDYMLMRCNRMFEWKNLPDEISPRVLELWLQTCGHVFITDKPDGKLRVFFGGLGGEPDYLYRPTLATIANPSLNYSGNLKIVWDKVTEEQGECVIILNDPLLKGLLPLHNKFASLETESDLTIRQLQINARAPYLLSADSERTRKSAMEFLNSIYEGKQGYVVDNDAFLEGVKEHQLDHQAHNVLSSVIETNKYISARWLGALGLNSLFQMKKEFVSDSEKSMSEDELLPLIESMLEERKRAVELINEKYGTEIEVDFASAWKDNYQEIELEHQIMAEEANNGSDESIGSTGGMSGLDSTTEEPSGEPVGESDTLDENEQSGDITESGAGNEDTSVDNNSVEGDNINVEVTVNVDSDESDKGVVEEPKEEEENE